MPNRTHVVFGVGLALLLLSGCAEERRYVGDGLVTVAITEDTPPVFMTEDGAIYIVETRVDLPVREPTQMTLEDLAQGAQGYENLPFPRLPLVTRGDLETQIDFTISSLDSEERDIGVIVNGYNEFHEYMPGVIVIDEEPTPERSQWERVYTLAPGARFTTTIREDELDEVAVDLATVVNGAPSSDEVVYFENHSSSDTRARPYIPQVIPALVGVRIGLRTLTEARVLLEASIRVRDVDGVLAEEGDPELVATPEPFTPAVPEDE